MKIYKKKKGKTLHYEIGFQQFDCAHEYVLLNLDPVNERGRTIKRKIEREIERKKERER